MNWFWVICWFGIALAGSLGSKDEHEEEQIIVDATSSKNANLQCMFQIPRALSLQQWTIRWTKEEDPSLIFDIVFDPFRRQSQEVLGNYLLSVGLEETNNSMGVSNLEISHVSSKHSGTYSCSIGMRTKPFRILKTIHLNVTRAPIPEKSSLFVKHVEGYEGTSLVLECQGWENLEVVWTIDVPPFSITQNTPEFALTHDGTTLTIKNVSNKSTGKYLCQAKEDPFTIFQTFQVTINRRPVETISNQVDLVVPNGQYVIFECPSPLNVSEVVGTEWWKVGDSKPLVQFNDFSKSGPSVQRSYADRMQRLDPIHGFAAGSIMLRNVFSLDSGSYFCKLKNKFGQDVVQEEKTEFKLVVFPKDGFGAVGPDITVIVDPKEPIKLICKVQSILENGAQVHWFKSSCPIVPDERHIISQAELQINPVQGSDSGQYVCQVTGSQPEFHLNHIFQVQVLVPDEFVEVPTDQEVQEGDFLELVCRPKEVAGANGVSVMPTVSWIKDGQPVLAKSFGRISVSLLGHKLSIRDVHPLDRGQYRCQATTRFDQLISHSFHVQVFHSPKVSSLQPPAQFLVKDQPGRLICLIDANPPHFKVRWYKNGRNVFLLQDKHRFFQTQDNQSDTLHWDQVTEDDQGFYRCEVESSDGMTAHSSEVFQVILVEPLYFVQKPDFIYIVNLTIDSSLKVPCRAIGIPRPKISLESPFVRAMDMVKYEVLNDSWIVFPNLTRIHSGLYSCLADNGVMKMNSDFLIRIHDSPPAPPHILSANFERNKQMLTIDWKSALPLMDSCSGPLKELPHIKIMHFPSKPEDPKFETLIGNVTSIGDTRFRANVKVNDMGIGHSIGILERNAFGWSAQSKIMKVDISQNPTIAKSPTSKTTLKPAKIQEDRQTFVLEDLQDLLQSIEVQKFIAFLAQEIVNLDYNNDLRL